jgi:hypothetical protein
LRSASTASNCTANCSTARRAPAQLGDLAELLGEAVDRRRRRRQQLADDAIALGIDRRRAALLDFVQAVMQRVDQQLAPPRVVEQVVLQVRVALHHPDVAQHLVQHARRAAGAAFLPQPVQDLPGPGAEQADDDLAVGERGVVVRDLAQARRGVGQLGGAGDLAEGGGCVHRVTGFARWKPFCT